MRNSVDPMPRLPILTAIFMAVFGIYLILLFSVQVVHHEEYLLRSANSITRVESVVASRGIITDRDGKTLVSNRSTYSLTFDESLLRAGEDKNEAILRLLHLCKAHGAAWNDHLPLTDAPPFALRADALSDTQKGRFLSYLKDLKKSREALQEYVSGHPSLLAEGETKNPLDRLPATALTNELLLSAGITPARLLAWMREDFQIDETCSDADARLISGVRYELKLRKLGTNVAYVLVDEVDVAFLSMLSDGDFRGVKVTRASVREYETDRAAHVLGTVGPISEYTEALKEKGYAMNDLLGQSGVEKAFEDYLRGTGGTRVISVNADGKITGEYYRDEPEPGYTVELTLDLDLQGAVEDALAEAVAGMNAKDGLDSRGAGAAVVKVGTGEVLALASCPTFSLATYRQDFAELLEDPAHPMNNRATNGTYPPGSTLKPATAVAALESGATTLSETLTDTGYWKYPSSTWSGGTWCWNRGGHGKVNATSAITNSCNYYFAEMGYRMGLSALNEYYAAFGLGEHTGIEIGDSAGQRATEEAGSDQAPWAAYGQANQLYTPLQLANYVATLVSGGKHCPAHLLKAVKSFDRSEVIATGETGPTNVVNISGGTLRAVKEGMLGYTTGSLSAYFSQCVVSAGAKTGTAQLGGGTKNNGVFVCFAPYDEPEIAVAIVMEHGDAGAALASTAVNILNAYFDPDGGAAASAEGELLP